MADQFAANGYAVFMPDLFHGDALSLSRPADFDFPKWLREGTDGTGRGHGVDSVDPVVEETIALAKAKGFTKIGVVAYCFVSVYKGGHG